MPLTDPIAEYDAELPPEQAELTKLLRAEIEAALPKCSSKVWHGHPVWFDGENPIVGYDARQKSVNVLFWNGQALGEPALLAIGKFKAAGTQYSRASEVDRAALRRWLEKARKNVFDGVSHFRRLREAAKLARTAGVGAAKPRAGSRKRTHGSAPKKGTPAAKRSSR